MNILMISNNYYPYSGGVARSIETTMTLLKQQGHTVHLITYDFDGKPEADKNIIRIPAFWRFTYRGKQIPVARQSKKIIRDAIGVLKPDVIHVHHPFLLGRIGQRLARRSGIPVVFTHHTLYEKFVHYLPFGRRLAAFCLPYYLSFFYRNLNGIIAPSEFVLQQIKSRTTTSTICLPSSVDPVFIQNVQRNDPFDGTRPIRLMTASRLVPEKNIDQLLYACSLLTVPFSLMIIGDGYLRKDLEDTAWNTYRLTPDQVSFVGSVDKATLAMLYQQADLFIFASQTETQGLVIGEALASGTPVIAFQGSGVEDALDSGGGYLVRDAQEMATQINKLYSNPHDLQKMCNTTLKGAQQFFPEYCIQRLLAVYKQAQSKVNDYIKVKAQ